MKNLQPIVNHRDLDSSDIMPFWLAPVPGDDDAVRHGSFVARRQTFQVAVLSTISRLWGLPQQRFFVPVEFLKDPQA